jgi:hypothetical protein
MSIGMNRTSTLDTVKDLSPEELAWQAGPEANPIEFLLWHMFRTEDRYVRFLTGQQETLETDGWNNKWTMPATITGNRAALTTGNSWTIEEVVAFKVPPLAELLAYGEAVRKQALATVKAMSPDKLNEVPYSERPDWINAMYLRSLITHEFGHQQQIDYIVGLCRAASAG